MNEFAQKINGESRSQIAYLCMEIGLESDMPTYAGGLGMLAGDTVRAAADLNVPMVAVSLVHRRGYFQQSIDADGRQAESSPSWDVAGKLEPLTARVRVEIEGRPVQIRAWRYVVTGVSGWQVPVYLLDTDLPGNAAFDRQLTDSLYGGGQDMRLSQEMVLGLGGVRMLRALGYREIRRFHMNEGHAALVTLALVEEALKGKRPKTVTPEVIEQVREKCVFTTHTPVPAGHDEFKTDMAQRILGPQFWSWLEACGQKESLSTTHLALDCSRYINAVSMRHAEVARRMFPGYKISAITNGVHVTTWASPPFQELFDRWLPNWRRDPLALRHALGIPEAEVWSAHIKAKTKLLDLVNADLTGTDHFHRDVLTLGYARRMTDYKRPMLLFHDLERLASMARHVGPLQIVFAGKAHPKDMQGKELIRQVIEAGRGFKGHLKMAFLENYDMNLGRILTAGADVWLNVPRPPMEASGTSGMKAAVNGVPSLSVLDGWWVEGHLEDDTGWAVGEYIEDPEGKAPDRKYAVALYDKLSKVILPSFYKRRSRFCEIMRKTISVNASFFNTRRMVTQYLREAYE